jgi:hypothetical protein
MDQNTYLEILFQDVGIDTRAKRNDWIFLRVLRKVSNLDELSKAEKHMLINLLKELKYEKNN